MNKNTLTITDNRTSQSYEVPITDGGIRATDPRTIRSGPDDPGLLSYDPAFMNTGSTRSALTFIDGDKGILRYRGYPIEQLAEHSTFLEVAYLLIRGELPTAKALDEWTWQITHHTWVHENVKKFMDGFHHDAHPMGMFISTVAALSTFYPLKGQPRLRPPRSPDLPVDREGPDDRRVRVPPHSGSAVRVPRQRSHLRRQFPQHAVQDHGAQVQGRPGDRARARRALHPARRSRAELLDERHAGRR